jgi:FtsP/CotA-like multicopper oxidase with cupredoxin domain
MTSLTCTTFRDDPVLTGCPRKSILGTLIAPLLPFFLTDNPLPNGFPWSTRDAFTDYHKDVPLTGVIRRYDFTISRGVIAPDGYQRDVLLVNGAFPGPLIEANWGDTIQVKVTNNITGPEEGTALHWHGFFQKGTPWFDGVPSISQCPIAPKKSFTYSFQADVHGSTWYHSHYSAQYAGGLFGPLIVYGPRNPDPKTKYDVDIGPVLLSDWYHAEYYDLVKQVMSPTGGLVFSDNNLINGKNNFNCSSVPAGDTTPCASNAGLAKFKFQRGKTHRLRLINSGAEGLQRFAIDGHKMTVIANDFVAVEPYQTDVVTLGIGQRADILVKADGKLDAYWMRSNISSVCGVTRQPVARAAIYYDNADQNKAPTSVATTPADDSGACANDDLALTKPVVKMPLPPADKTYTMDIKLFRNATNHLLFSLNEVAFRGNMNSPTLLLADLGNTTFDPIWNVINTGAAKSVRVVVNNQTPIPHPMHLHGFDMYVLKEGPGAWDGSIVRQTNPQRRDVIQVRGNGHVVIQFDAASNPGVWPFHCHIAWHVSAGLLTQFLTNPVSVERMKVPNTVAETCRQWGAWTNTNIPEQIDSGL